MVGVGGRSNLRPIHKHNYQVPIITNVDGGVITDYEALGISKVRKGRNKILRKSQYLSLWWFSYNNSWLL